MADEWSRQVRLRQRCSAIVRARRRPCCICGQPINYALQYPNPLSFSVQHVISRKARPDLTFDLTNLDAAHLECNQSQGDTPQVTERVTSRRW